MKRARFNDLVREDEAYTTRLAEWKALLYAYYKDAAVKLVEIVGYWPRENLYLRLEPRLELIHGDDVILYEHHGRVLCGINNDAPYPLDDDALWPWAMGTVNWDSVPRDVVACIARHVDAYHKVTMAHTCRKWRYVIVSSHTSMWDRHAAPFKCIISSAPYALFYQMRSIFRARNGSIMWYNLSHDWLRILFFVLTTSSSHEHVQLLQSTEPVYNTVCTWRVKLQVNPGNLCCTVIVRYNRYIISHTVIREALRYFLFNNYHIASHRRYLLDCVINEKHGAWRDLINSSI